MLVVDRGGSLPLTLPTSCVSMLYNLPEPIPSLILVYTCLSLSLIPHYHTLFKWFIYLG